MHGEVDRLTAVAAQLAEIMAKQKPLADPKPRNEQQARETSRDA